MSRGPGIIERQLFAIFEKNPERSFSTRELCREVYDIQDIEKKHRVSVLRVLKRISSPLVAKSRSLPSLRRMIIKGDRDDIWFVYRRIGSYDKLPQNSTPARCRRPRKHRRKLPAVMSQLRHLSVKDRLKFIADMDDFPLTVIPSDVVEQCSNMIHLLKPDVRERLLMRLEGLNSGAWKLLRKKLQL